MHLVMIFYIEKKYNQKQLTSIVATLKHFAALTKSRSVEKILIK